MCLRDHAEIISSKQRLPNNFTLLAATFLCLVKQRTAAKYSVLKIKPTASTPPGTIKT